MTYANISFSKLRLNITQSNTSHDALLTELHDQAYWTIYSKIEDTDIGDEILKQAEVEYACYLYVSEINEGLLDTNVDRGENFKKHFDELMKFAIDKDQDWETYYTRMI